MSDPALRRWNIVTGVAALALVAVLFLWWAVGAALVPKGPEMNLYVAYFDDVGGLRAGDRVRIKGRSAGFVRDVRVVQHEGRTRARVEFEIAPGTGSQWLKELPADSELRVQVPRLRGSPQLNISPGDSQTMIPVGGELKKTVSASANDQLAQFKAELAKFDEYVDQVIAILDGPMIEKVINGLNELNRRAIELDGMLQKGVEQAVQIAAKLQEATDLMSDLRRDLDGRWAQVRENVDSAGANAAEGDKGLGEIADQVARLGQSVADFERSISGLAESLQSREVADAGRQLRRISAQTRASMDRSRADPKTFGDMPTWRFLRKYYHGETFKPGTGKEKYDSEP